MPPVRSQQRFLELAEASARQPLVGPAPSESPTTQRTVRSRKSKAKKG